MKSTCPLVSLSLLDARREEDGSMSMIRRWKKAECSQWGAAGGGDEQYIQAAIVDNPKVLHNVRPQLTGLDGLICPLSYQCLA